MIITRTPLRISFFGGGTDYPIWFQEHGGAVLSTSIDKYSYLICRRLPPFFDFKIRVGWSKMELVQGLEEIQHPAVREVLRFFDIQQGIEIHYNGDLPARSGLGSSSSFVVGLLNALSTLEGKSMSKEDLARTAIHVERNLLKEAVGSQDQVAAAFGGFNKIIFKPNDEIAVIPLALDAKIKNNLQDRLMMFFTGVSRNASEIAAAQINNISRKEKELMTMQAMVDEGANFLKTGDLDMFGKLLHESWQLKRGLSHLISNSQINEMYELAIANGALGGKVLGAGGGGFMLFYADPKYHEKIKKALEKLLYVPFKFENEGSQIVYSADGLK